MQEKELKQTYNKTLRRFYNGCNYLDLHPEEEKKYYSVVKDLYVRLGKILSIIKNYTEEEALNGFK